MRQYPLIMMLILPCLAFCQTNISGVINSYHKVLEVIPSKSCVRVDNTAGLSYNDRVMIIQMKGATVNLTNTSAFGSTTAMNNAGKYEIGTICWIKLDSVFLFKEIFQTYSVADKVQLVRIPQYEIAVVTDSLKAEPWNNATGKGGVLALTVYDQLILNAPVSVIGAGFSGGAFATSNTTCSNLTAPAGFFYNASQVTPQSGAYKGESVTEVTGVYTGGKGANANGGGGGNNHNNGGGGGGNLASGGNGGGNSSASGCTVSNPGIGGYALNSNSGSRIFLGGGGGAGHANGLPSTGGGRGGGIAFIQADNVYSNGYKILANGLRGGNTTSDGASGGGAGGTIILDVNNYIGGLNVEAIGGIGGTESDDNTSQKCYGEGGGGSGGVIYLKTGVPAGTININGGPKGIKQFFLNCAPLVPATAGAPGVIVPNYTYMQSAVISSYCEVVLPVHLVSFEAIPDDSNVRINWEIADADELKYFIVQKRKDGNGWTNLDTIAVSAQNLRYGIVDKNIEPGSYQYRLEVVGTNGGSGFSKIQAVRIGTRISRPVLFPNPASGEINIIYPFRKGSDVRIYDLAGKLVKTNRFNVPGTMVRMDISDLNSGIYLVMIDGQSAKMVVRE